MNPYASLRARRALAVIALLLAVALSGCSPAVAPTSALTTGSALAKLTVKRPAPWDLTTPEKATRSYLDWVTLSYRLVNSELSTPTMEPTETVRVDSYIQLNKEQNKGLDQTLLSFTVASLKTVGDRATLVAHEEWEYRYFDLKDPTRYVSPLNKAQYDATYFLVRGKDNLWRVDSVEAKPIGEVK